ncbi:MAG: nucleoside hydrolase, partial [Pseudomonadota bacterium]
VDPEAADIVFGSGVDLVMMPLDVTHKALITGPWLDAVKAVETSVMQTMAAWLNFYERFDVEKYGGAGGPLHDPCVIAWLLQPELFSGRRINVEIETSSALTRGMTVADWWGVTDRPANALFIGDVNASAFFELLKSRIETL